MNCLIVLNKCSSHCNVVDIARVTADYTSTSDNVTLHEINAKRDYSTVGYDKVIVCGGDGTLHHALNKCNNSTVKHLVYIGCGTLNESCKVARSQIGKANDTLYSYVLASGTLTDIAYKAKTSTKRHVGKCAYLMKAITSYKVHNFHCRAHCDSFAFDKNLTLLMVLHSDRCFGFKFNKMYDKNDDKMYLLALRSHGKNNLFNKIKLFFTLARVFFMGINKPLDSKNIFFNSFTDGQLTFDNDLPWCVDGENKHLDKTITLTTMHPYCKLTLVDGKGEGGIN